MIPVETIETLSFRHNDRPKLEGRIGKNVNDTHARSTTDYRERPDSAGIRKPAEREKDNERRVQGKTEVQGLSQIREP